MKKLHEYYCETIINEKDDIVNINGEDVYINVLNDLVIDALTTVISDKKSVSDLLKQYEFPSNIEFKKINVNNNKITIDVVAPNVTRTIIIDVKMKK